MTFTACACRSERYPIRQWHTARNKAFVLRDLKIRIVFPLNQWAVCFTAMNNASSPFKPRRLRPLPAPECSPLAAVSSVFVPFALHNKVEDLNPSPRVLHFHLTILPQVDWWRLPGGARRWRDARLPFFFFFLIVSLNKIKPSVSWICLCTKSVLATLPHVPGCTTPPPWLTLTRRTSPTSISSIKSYSLPPRCKLKPGRHPLAPVTSLWQGCWRHNRPSATSLITLGTEAGVRLQSPIDPARSELRLAADCVDLVCRRVIN